MSSLPSTINFLTEIRLKFGERDKTHHNTYHYNLFNSRVGHDIGIEFVAGGQVK